jgi:succinate dehydrogenase / fumarate reductase cytochrome b subunit
MPHMQTAGKRQDRVKFLNLFQIRFPVTAVISIGHRITGIALFLAIPLLIYLLELSLSSAAGYTQAIDLLDRPLLRFVSVLLIWAFAHHFYAGIRYLLLDIDIGVSRNNASQSSWLVLIAGFVTMLAAAVWLL